MAGPTSVSISASWPAQGAPVRAIKAGDVIFREGDPAEELFIIKSGKVEIRLGNRLLDTLPELSIFGEMALIDHGPAQRDGSCGNRRDPRPGRREAVSVSGQPHAVFCAERYAHPGTAAAQLQHRGLLGNSRIANRICCLPLATCHSLLAFLVQSLDQRHRRRRRAHLAFVDDVGEHVARRGFLALAAGATRGRSPGSSPCAQVCSRPAQASSSLAG